MAKEEEKLGGAKAGVIRDLTREGLDIEANDDTFPEWTSAELSAALSGKTVIDNSDNIVINFRKASSGEPMPYAGEINGVTVYFNAKGRTDDGTIKLALATTVISNKGTQGEAQTRSGDAAEFIMNSLNFKEQIALRVLPSIIHHEQKPLSYDDSKIKLLVSQSFRIAVEFQNRAIMFRKAEQGGGGSGGVDIDTESLTDNTEKLLYNISEYLKNGVAIKGSTELGASAVRTEVKDLDIVTNSYDVPAIKNNEGALIDIDIKVGIYKKKYIRFEVTDYMIYSDLYILLELKVKEESTPEQVVTKKVSITIPKGSIVYIGELNPADDVAEITEIVSKTIKGKGNNDLNKYKLISA